MLLALWTVIACYPVPPSPSEFFSFPQTAHRPLTLMMWQSVFPLIMTVQWDTRCPEITTSQSG